MHFQTVEGNCNSPGDGVLPDGTKPLSQLMLTHWGRATHICVSKLTIIASDNGLLLGWRQAIIWNNAGILSIRNKLQWNFNQNSDIFFQENALESVVCEMVSILSRPQCVTFPSVRFCGIFLRAVSLWLAKLLFCIMNLTIVLSILLPHLPGTNELI